MIKVNQQQLDKFLEALESDQARGNVEVAIQIRKGDVSRTSVYAHKKINKKFSDRWDEIVKASKPILVQELEATMRARALGGNPTLLIFMLKNLAPKQWKDRMVHGIGGENGGAIPVKHEMPDLENWLKGFANKKINGTNKSGSKTSTTGNIPK